MSSLQQADRITDRELPGMRIATLYADTFAVAGRTNPVRRNTDKR